MKGFTRKGQIDRLSDICLENARSLSKALRFCDENSIGSFRVNSQILPLMTHPEVGYDIDDLPLSDAIKSHFRTCGEFASTRDIRLTFHPDQFVLLSSKTLSVTRNSIAELEYQAQIAEWINADVINIHGGGMYGNKKDALVRLEKEILKLSEPVRSRLTLENDDRIYTPSDLLPVCLKTRTPLVYDVHHHRVNPDDLAVCDVTPLVLKTWNREPLFHISSSKNGRNRNDQRKHHDFIEPGDFPECWRNLDITLEVEAKAKEEAVLKFKKDIGI